LPHGLQILFQVLDIIGVVVDVARLEKAVELETAG